MKTDSAKDGGRGIGGPPLRLELLLAYEDRPTAERAKLAVAHVLSQSGVNSRPQFRLWRFDVLGVPELREQAEKEAAKANILVVSMHGKNCMATDAEACVIKWIGLKRAKPCSLVISLDLAAKPLPDKNSSVFELRSAAARCGMDALLQFAEPAFPIKEAAISDLQRRANAPLQGFDQSSHWMGSYRDLGINE